MSGELYHSQAYIIRQLMIDRGLVTHPDDEEEWPCNFNSLPEEPDNALVITDTEGRAQGRVFTGYLTEKHGIQIRSRSADVVSGFVKLTRILNSLSRVNNEEVVIMEDTGTGTTSYLVQTLTPTSPVVRLGREAEGGRYEWTLNLVISLRMIE